MSSYGFNGEWLHDSVYLGSEVIATLRPATTLNLEFNDMLGDWLVWEDDQWKSASISDNGNGEFWIIDEDGFEGLAGLWDPQARRLTSFDWGWVHGHVSANGRKITWDNGFVWHRSSNQIPEDLGVDFLHVDALGSVRGVTDMLGHTVAQHSYGAFGEGPGVTPAGEKQRFVGTERDGETFLDYMGARYYRNVVGRFGSVDPTMVGVDLARPQSWNRYAYGLNNPSRYVDRNGLFATKVHDAILEAAFPRLAGGPLLAAMQQGSQEVDYDQSSWGAYKHGMSAYYHSDRKADEIKGNAFIKHYEDLARFDRYRHPEHAHNFFGRAAHTIMDRLSPAHRGNQPWRGIDAAGTGIFWIELWQHGQGEPGISLMQFEQAVLEVRAAYLETFGAIQFRQATGCESLGQCSIDRNVYFNLDQKFRVPCILCSVTGGTWNGQGSSQ